LTSNDPSKLSEAIGTYCLSYLPSERVNSTIDDGFFRITIEQGYIADEIFTSVTEDPKINLNSQVGDNTYSCHVNVGSRFNSSDSYPLLDTPYYLAAFFGDYDFTEEPIQDLYFVMGAEPVVFKSRP
jgi:hypothetical protein